MATILDLVDSRSVSFHILNSGSVITGLHLYSCSMNWAGMAGLTWGITLLVTRKRRDVSCITL